MAFDLAPSGLYLFPSAKSAPTFTQSPSTSSFTTTNLPTVVEISLNTVLAPLEDRKIELHYGQPEIIGRSSKSQRCLFARPDNGLFNCPVVSRNHAEIELVHRGTSSSVVIRDRGSMHGTKVNGTRLRAKEDYALKDGDIIKLGEHVVRNNDSHDGLMLEYRRTNTAAVIRNPETQSSKRSFTVPNYTDDEDSYDDSEGEDDYSVMSGEDHGSSAQTTPDSKKAKVGTTEHPIDVDNLPMAPSVEVMDLTNDDFDEPEPRHPPIQHGSTVVEDSLRVIPETFNDDLERSLSPEGEDSDPEPPFTSKDVYLDSDEDGHEETGDAEDYPSSDRSFRDDDNDEEKEEEEDDYPEQDDISFQKQSSPELGTPIQSISKSEASPTSSRPRFDPVRDQGSTGNGGEGWLSGHNFPLPPIESMDYGDGCVDQPLTGFSKPKATRWDVPPLPRVLPNLTFDSHSNRPSTSYKHAYGPSREFASYFLQDAESLPTASLAAYDNKEDRVEAFAEMIDTFAAGEDRSSKIVKLPIATDEGIKTNDASDKISTTANATSKKRKAEEMPADAEPSTSNSQSEAVVPSSQPPSKRRRISNGKTTTGTLVTAMTGVAVGAIGTYEFLCTPSLVDKTLAVLDKAIDWFWV